MIERGGSSGSFVQRQRRARGMRQQGTFLRTVVGPGLAVCCAAYFAVVVTGHLPRFHPPHAVPLTAQHAGDGIGQEPQQTEVARQTVPLAAQSAEAVSAPERRSVLAKLTRSRVQDLKLVGISWSDVPDALIEDMVTHTTFFLKKGQSIEGGILVKDIYKDKVIVESHGRQVELQ